MIKHNIPSAVINVEEEALPFPASQRERELMNHTAAIAAAFFGRGGSSTRLIGLTIHRIDNKTERVGRCLISARRLARTFTAEGKLNEISDDRQLAVIGAPKGGKEGI